jgi:LPS-assembly protein
LQDLAANEADTPSRTAPISNLDVGAVFDRFAGKQNQNLITLEPRAQYTYIPYRNQDDLPVFDTIVPDFNLIQLYRNNRFIGYDRLGDTNQLSAGFTSRVLDAGNGRELLAVSLGQTRYFDDGRVSLPGETTDEFDESNYIAELDVRTWENWNAGLDLQWDAENDEADRSSVRVQYRPGENKALNAAYRYARDSLEQTDFSFTWPISENWQAIGRYNYSVRDSEALERFVGLEYESCCWAVRTIWQRRVTNNDGESDSTIAVQFEMKGFSNVGSGSVTSMKRDILRDWTR